jgi:uncharacterized protein YgiB involved in biofilm formation
MKKSIDIQLSKTFTEKIGEHSKLLAATTVLPLSFTLSACTSEPDITAYTYKNEQACIDAGIFTEKACRDTSQKALQSHLETAPRFELKKDCEDSYGAGNCQQEQPKGHTAHGTSNDFFTPLMLGYLIGHHANNTNHGGTTYSTPVYRAANGSYATANGSNLGSDAFSKAAATTGTVTRNSALSKPAPAGYQSHESAVRSRGGFGSTVRSGSSGTARVSSGARMSVSS